MSFEEMVEMVNILKRADYDGKYGLYLNPNVRKAEIMTKVVKSLRRNFGVGRSKEQLRKHWGEKTRSVGGNQEPTTPEEGEQSIVVPQDVEEGEVKEVLKSGITTDDVQVVVPKSSHFTSDSAQRIIHEIMFCSRDLHIFKEKNKEIEQRLKNMIDVLGRI
ncbi:hypothetical protein AB205_0039460 [Aquarana catesbeiana]|uniref:Uncharacterized protein n=1 Tax=Aquarana catesbeiana TaxID=8400 RepID=A0A2G9R663_AQUCT|nr:hypothetical protein AB205_0039460 [Aquarana catesbeiana]